MRFSVHMLIVMFILSLFPVWTIASTWAKTYGGSNDDLAFSIQESSDNGFIVAG